MPGNKKKFSDKDLKYLFDQASKVKHPLDKVCMALECPCIDKQTKRLMRERVYAIN